MHRIAISTIVALTTFACADSSTDEDIGEDEDEFRSTSWTTDSRGNYFREATAQERTNNKWPTGTYLMRYAAASVRTNRLLPVVTSPTQVQYVSLDPAVTSTGVSYSALSFHTSASTSTTPTFYRLPAAASSTTKGHVTVDSSNGLIAHVTISGLPVPSREIIAAESNAYFDPIALPGGGVPAASELLVEFTPPDPAMPSASNDIAISNPATSTPLAMFGTMYWCQQHPTNWKSLIAESAFELRAGFRAEEPGPGTTDTGWNIVLQRSWCMFWDVTDSSRAAVDKAKACEWGKDPANACGALVCTDTNGIAYPMTGCYGLAGCFTDKVWDAVEYADRYLALPNLMLAQAQTWGVLQDPADPDSASPSCPGDTISGNASRLCGLAKAPSAGALAGASMTPGRPYSAWPPDFNGIDACGTPYVWTHEVGHNHVAYHEPGTFDPAPHNSGCDNYKTLMQISTPPIGEVTCTQNWFSPTITDFMLTNCVAGSCPRTAAYVDHLP